MSNPNLCDKDYVSVLPRIIDPKMQFTKESIENTFEKKQVNGSNMSSVNNVKKKNIVSIPIENESKDIQKTSNFLSDYKYVILIVIIVIIIIVIIYFIYRYFNHKHNKIASDNTKDNKSQVEAIDTIENQKTIENDPESDKLKDDTVKSYISNYIIKEDYIENDDTDDTDIIEKEDDIFVDESYNKFEINEKNARNNKPQQVLLHTKDSNLTPVNKIIDKTPTYIKVKQNIDMSEVNDIVDSTNNSPNSPSNLYMNDDKSETYSDLDDTSSKNTHDAENYDNLIYDTDDTLVYDNEYKDGPEDNLINDNYDSIFNDNIITNAHSSNESDKGSEKEMDISKSSKKKSKEKISKTENTDDLTYFQKFNKSK